jgi:mannose-6-phosphate isomerase-like protein (cupin superfamily)
MSSTPSIRRVVLGAGPDGATTVRSDGPAPTVVQLPAVPGTALVDLWRSETLPLDPRVADDPTVGDFELMPAGSLFRIIDLAPTGDAEPMWHRTDSVDLIYIASGRVTCRYDGGEVELAAGDTIVQQAVRHAWVNSSDTICRLINVSIATA